MKKEKTKTENTNSTNELNKKKPTEKKSSKPKKILNDEEIKKKKTRKTKVAMSCFVLLLAVGVVGNWYWENSDISSKINTISNTKTLGEATFVDATTEATTESSYFSSARVDRQSSRDESLEKLQKVIDSVDESEEAHKAAETKIEKITSYINIENKIETLVTAKGIDNCIAVINDDGTKVDVIIDKKDADENTVLQIKEIATEQLSCSYESVTIIESQK